MRYLIVASRGRYLGLGGGERTKQRPELNKSCGCNTITSVAKDNLVLVIMDDSDKTGK